MQAADDESIFARAADEARVLVSATPTLPPSWRCGRNARRQ
jgi:hypothetical protein